MKSLCVSALTGSVQHKMTDLWELNPCGPTNCYLPWPLRLKPQVMYQYSEENNIILITFSSLKLILCVQILVLGMLNLNTKGRHYLTKFLTANPLLIHLITWDIDWSWNIITLHNFLLNAHQAADWPQKLRTESLRTVQILVNSLRSSYGWFASNTADNYLQKAHWWKNHARHHFQAFARHHMM